MQLHLRVARLDAADGVAAGPGQRVRIALDGVDGRARHLVGQGEGDRAAAGAQVHAQRGVDYPQRVDGVLHHRLGLGPRDEHARSHLELDVAEADAAGQVLQRNAVGPAPD